MVAPSTGTAERSPSPTQYGFVAPYHKVYLLLLLGPLTIFTLLSLIFQTHAYNVSLSSLRATGTLTAADVAAQTLKPVASIFAQRTNFLNRYFIKLAWAWTSLAWLAQALTLRGPESPEAMKATRIAMAKGKGKGREDGGDQTGPQDQEATIASPLAKSLLRYGIATASWVCFSLWLFGPPLMERILTSSGGVCIPHPAGDALDGISNPSGEASTAGDPSAFRMPGSPIDEAFCRAGRRGISHSERPDLFKTAHFLVTEGIGSGRLKGVWRGGHDVSGHTFILLLSSLLLLEEVTPYMAHFLYEFLPSSLQYPLPKSLTPVFPRTLRSNRNPFRREEPARVLNALVMVGILSLVALWIFCIVNTALYFHTPAEKISGAFIALVVWAVLPKGG